MDVGAAPMNIATLRDSSISPHRRQISNLTSALQSTSGNEAKLTPAMNIDNGKPPHDDSITGGLIASGSYHGSGAQPISMNSSNRDRPRRESLAGSMVTGMSWGGVSVGSFIRDEYACRNGIAFDFGQLTIIRIIMEGSSPFPQQSPSFHSSSYIPKMEADFMKDFSCCGLTMGSLHDLLRHYEENHFGSLQQRNISSQVSAPPDSKAAVAVNTANAVQQRAQQQHQQQNDAASQSKVTSKAHPQSGPATLRAPQAHPVVGGGCSEEPYSAAQHHPSLDMDAVQDMEMDDVDYSTQSNSINNAPWSMSNQPRMMQRSRFGQPPSSRVPPLDLSTMNLGNAIQQHQGLRNSTPSTPVAASRGGTFYHNNPTFSSVNTPTFPAHRAQPQHYMPTPDSSAPGTPGEIENDFIGNLGTMDGAMGAGDSQSFMQNRYAGLKHSYQFGNGSEMLDLCIDEPAKRLFSSDGDYNNGNQVPNSARLGDAQYSENSELARTIREQQKLAGIPDGGSGPSDGTAKPFHCPVIGCEKAYKNQNGLKYHKSVSCSILYTDGRS